jgi:hypothetical protein
MSDPPVEKKRPRKRSQFGLRHKRKAAPVDQAKVAAYLKFMQPAEKK